jgi:cytochrome P450
MSDTETADLLSAAYPSPEIVECPFGFYAALRDEAPVHRLPNGDFVVSRWQDVVYIDRHPELFSNFIGPLNPGFAEAYGVQMGEGALTPWPLPFTDPPEHRLKRSLLLPMVSRMRMAEYEPMIREIADGLIDRFIDDGACEFKSAFADELPPTVMLRIFDVPLADEPMVRAWMQTSQGQGYRHASEEQKARQRQALGEARAYFEKIVLDRFENPGPDFLSEFVRSKHDRDGSLDLYYLIGEVTTVYQAAYHNTIYMLTSLLQLLLENPDQMAKVLADRDLLRNAVDESLRVESPVQWLQRIVVEDTELHGVMLPKGAVVLIMYGAANRDERTFPEPERFDVERPNVLKQQLGFGHGIHMCLGAPLARLEGQVAFEQLLSRLTNIRLAEGKNDFAHVATVNHRALKALHIEFDAA